MYLEMMTITCVFGSLILILLSLLWYYIRLGIGPTPSGHKARRLLVQTCLNEISERSQTRSLTIHELGFGWGGLTIALMRVLNRSETRGMSISIKGYELSLIPYYVTRLLFSLRPSSFIALSLLHQDGVEALKQTQDGDLVLCYLCPRQMRRIADLSQSGTIPGALTLISLLFALPDHQPTRVTYLNNVYRDPVYLYQIGKR